MEQINFKQERDLGATLQVASAFIKQHFLKIMKPTLVVVIVPLLLGTFVMMTSMQSMYSSGQMMGDPMEVYAAMAGMIPAYMLLIVTFVLAYVMFIGYIKLYASGEETIGLKELLPILKTKAPMLVVSSFLLIIVIYIGAILCVLPGIYLSIVFTHFFAISIIEERGFGDSWKRSFFIIKDNWWSSFGLYLVTYLISLGIAILLYIPVYAVMGLELFNAALESDQETMNNAMYNLTYLQPLYYLVGLVITLLYAVVSALRYFSLVELKEGAGEREMIESL